jgi:CRP-like cAMP-binding protein
MRFSLILLLHDIKCRSSRSEVMYLTDKMLIDTYLNLNVRTGQKGDYFYIIESGVFEVIVNGVAVATLESGKSFGELALLYNTPRAATVYALTNCVVYALDRDTFRNTLANTSFSKVCYTCLCFIAVATLTFIL